MNGPTPVAEPTTMMIPKNTSMATNGIIHQSLRCHRKERSSPPIPSNELAVFDERSARIVEVRRYAKDPHLRLPLHG